MAEGKGHTELLPCPFCGGAADIIQRGRKYFSTVYECVECGCRLATTEKSDYGTRWNNRSTVNTYPAVEGLVKALEGARQFITNGIELGYIRMPDSDTPDPAHQRLPQIEAALSRFRSLQNGGANG